MRCLKEEIRQQCMRSIMDIGGRRSHVLPFAPLGVGRTHFSLKLSSYLPFFFFLLAQSEELTYSRSENWKRPIRSLNCLLAKAGLVLTIYHFFLLFSTVLCFMWLTYPVTSLHLEKMVCIGTTLLHFSSVNCGI